MIDKAAIINSPKILSLFEHYLRSPMHGWSIGIPGAIGEFIYDEDEPVDIQITNSYIQVVSPRGALLIDITPDIRCIAYEELNTCIKSWSQVVAFCVPDTIAQLVGYNVFTELGADKAAVTTAVNNEILFDLGLGSPYMQFCIRTGDAELINLLRKGVGHPVFDNENSILQAVHEASPTRVVISSLARIEIYSTIPEANIDTPNGPHTHLLPQLLNSNKRPPVWLPEGFTVALTLNPAHPLFDKYGKPRTFDRTAYDDFQNLLVEFGAPEYCAEKVRMNNLMSNDTNSEVLIPDVSPWQHLAQRVLRLQLPHI